MLQDRYETEKLFDHILQLTYEMDLVLAQIDQLLDNEALYQLIRNDLANYRVSHQKLVNTRHDSENPVGMSASNSGHPDRVLTKYLLDQLNNKS